MTPAPDPRHTPEARAVPPGATSLGNGSWLLPPPGPVTPGKGVRLSDLNGAIQRHPAGSSAPASRPRPVRREPGPAVRALHSLLEWLGVRR